MLFRSLSDEAPVQVAEPRPGRWREAGTALAVGLALWWAPVLLAAAALGPGHVLVEIGMFFSKLATVSFGGAYALLSYLAQEAVHTYGWMSAPEMVDGLGLAETLPGPLIKVTQFVGSSAPGAIRDHCRRLRPACWGRSSPPGSPSPCRCS